MSDVCERFVPDEWDPVVCAYCALPPEKHRKPARSLDEIRAACDRADARLVALFETLDRIEARWRDRYG